MAMPGVRLTTCPLAFLATKVRSRVVLMCRAICWMASSQEMSSQRSDPGRRTLGVRIRFGLSMSYLSVAPFGQSVPRLIGLSGSPSTCTTVGVTFFALSPRVGMVKPHATARYGHILRVSVLRAILTCRIPARARDTSNPIPAAAPATTAPFKNVRRFIEPPRPSGRADQGVPFHGPCRSGMRLDRSGPSPDAPRTLHSSVTCLSTGDQLEAPTGLQAGRGSEVRLAPRLQTGGVTQQPSREKKTMRSRFSLLILAVAGLAAPAFAQNDAPAGRWDGILVRNGSEM